MAQSVIISNDILHEQENIAIPQQPLIFYCVTSGTAILEWKRPEYIGLQLLSINGVERNFSSANNLAIGTCTNISYDGTIEVIESMLYAYVIASLQHPTSTVAYRNNSVGTSIHLEFNTTGKYMYALTYLTYVWAFIYLRGWGTEIPSFPHKGKQWEGGRRERERERALGVHGIY